MSQNKWKLDINNNYVNIYLIHLDNLSLTFFACSYTDKKYKILTFCRILYVSYFVWVFYLDSDQIVWFTLYL